MGSKWTKLPELTYMGHMTTFQVREKKLVQYSRNYRTNKKNGPKMTENQYLVEMGAKYL